MQNFAECIAGKGKFCGRNAAASCPKKLRGQKEVILSATVIPIEVTVLLNAQVSGIPVLLRT